MQGIHESVCLGVGRGAPSYHTELISAPKGSPPMMPGPLLPHEARWVMTGMILNFFRRKGGTRGIIFKTLERVVMANWCCSLRVLEGGAAWKDGHFSISKCDPREGGFPRLAPTWHAWKPSGCAPGKHPCSSGTQDLGDCASLSRASSSVLHPNDGPRAT